MSLDLEIAEAGKNEMLLQAIDRAVLGGKMKIEAAQDCYDLYATKCLVDGTSLLITLDGLDLDAALAKILTGRPLWQPNGPDAKVIAQNELEAAALAGNVSAHGKLFKAMGKEGYEAWRAKHAAKPGAPGKGADDTSADHKTNPWHKSNWNVTKQGSVTKAVGAEKAAEIAGAVGVTLGATRPNPNY